MTATETARASLRAHLNSGKAHWKQIQFLLGQIICARIVVGEIAPKLKPAHKIRIGVGELTGKPPRQH